ncbi:hypothetical protein C8R43DRAFT_289070 [Mycena crocata]|nr:hypothetical protein C8R43DRAFT_289070 [Mycena crocata]
MHVRILELSSYIGLTVAICEILATLRPELKYIWINPQRFTLIKFLYLLSRYLGLAVHITNTVFAILVGHYQVIPVHLCRIGLVYQGAVLFVMLGILDVILMIRVYALYNRRTSIAVIFGILLLSKITSAILSAFLALPNQQYNSTCLVMTGSQVPLYLFAVGELVIQLTILGFTLIRHIFATRDGWSNPLFGVLSRDGSMAFAATTGMTMPLSLSTSS